MPLRLLRPRYPSVTDTAGYFHIQVAHRRHAIELARGAIAAWRLHKSNSTQAVIALSASLDR